MNNLADIQSFVNRYAVQLYSYDEMISQNREVRPHWQDLFARIASLGIKELENRSQEIERLLKENGVTYSVYGDPSGLNRTWKLDPIPFAIQANDWITIENGLKQRAELLNLILTDLYTDRRLIKNNLLPAELVYAHHGFLRQCDQVKIPGKSQLLIYAADLARGPDGRMWVLNDRTQAPSGLGYALENRFTTRRILPDLFKQTDVRRLSHFFNAIRNTFPRIAQKDNPNVVILTPGPSNETYFEHSFLASYLGYNLTQGDDLTVRNNKLWLKTMGGLEPVDIVIRRVDDTFCDPLELRNDSRLGVAGLLEAVRHQNVILANPLGSGILENPGLMAFLPGIAKYFLNEELILPMAASWWCGQPKELGFVLENLDQLVIKSIQPSLGSNTVFGSSLSAMKLDNWRKRILANPTMYVAQELVDFSTSPSFINGQLTPRYSVLRGFVVASEQEYVVMPGGLTRNSPERGNLFVSNQAGGTSKDTWVLMPDEDINFSIGSMVKIGQQTRGLESMPSRSAENLFWVGRYTERAKGTARLLRTVLSHVQEQGKFEHPSEAIVTQTLLAAITQVTMTYPGFIGKEGAANRKKPENELMALAGNASKMGGLASNVQFLLNASLQVRDRWSTDTLRILDTLKVSIDHIANEEEKGLRNLQNNLDQFVTSLAAFVMFNRESLGQEQGWMIFDTGRRLERILQLIYLVRATLCSKASEAVEYYIMEAVLMAKESLSTYRYQYRTQLVIENVLDLLLLDKSHPSSLSYQLDRLVAYFDSLPSTENHFSGEDLRLRLNKIYKQLHETPIHELCKTGKNSIVRVKLDHMLGEISNEVFEISTLIVNHYFSHLNYAHQLVATL